MQRMFFVNPADFRCVFFEKKRIDEGEEKTALRLKQEEAFPDGRNMSMLQRNRVWMHESATSCWDSLGRLVITSNGVSRTYG